MDEEFISVIKLWAGYRCPTNFMFCEGQSLPIRNHEALFSLIGTTYGGDGVNNFSLPDMRPKTDTSTYKLQNTTVFRSHESGDPGTIGYVADGTVTLNHKQTTSSNEWGNSPKYIICVFGIYPSFD